MKKKKQKTVKDKKPQRPPVVVVLGHIDHGKTSILDAIRKTKVAERESGGITQHIGAYQVTHNEKAITFIDTPGHEAFSAMRARGAKVADVAVLVVAGDDGVKPQTKEAITIAKETETPLIVAINKIDKPSVDPERVKGQLAENGILLEGRGGDVPAVLLSAKNGQGIEELLEVIALVAELHCDLEVDTQVPASGVVLEARQDARRGSEVTFLIQRGTLHIGDVFVAGSASGKVRFMEDFQGSPLTEALPSTPVQILGMRGLPVLGDQFSVVSSESEAEERIRAHTKDAIHAFPEFIQGKPEVMFPFLLKADVQGSLEALAAIFGALPVSVVGLRPISVGVGEITEADVKYAAAAGAVIFGFRVRASKQVLQFAERQKVSVQTSDVIYELLEKVQKNMKGLLRPEIRRHELGTLEVLKIFRKDGARQIVGGSVQSGKIIKGAKIEILREGTAIGKGKIFELQRDRDPTDSVEEGHQCGLSVDGSTTIAAGDIIQCFEEERLERSLE